MEIEESATSQQENTEDPFVIVPTGVVVPLTFEVPQIFHG